MNKLESILLVDDDEATNFINELLISDLDIAQELLIARNGQEAIDLIRKRCQSQASSKVPQLILLDINMPVMDGFSFLEEYESLSFPDKGNVVIAVLTTSLNPKDIEKVRVAGVTDFLSKPLTESVLKNLQAKHFSQ